MQMQCVVSVSEIIHILPDGASIFVGVTENGSKVRAVASGRVMRTPAVLGSTYRLVGKFQQHADFGKQFQIAECRPELPSGRLMVNFLAQSSAFKGIGKLKARRLWHVFGDELPAIISAGSVKRLSLVLSRTLAERVIETWSKFTAEVEVLRFLEEKGFEWTIAEKIIRVWGERALDILDGNPYRMLAFSNWRAVDQAARQLGVVHRDERRLIAAVEACLYDRLGSGHTLTPNDLLHDLVDRRLKLKVAGRAIDLARIDGAISGNATWGYQTVVVHAMEMAIQRRVHTMLDQARYKSNWSWRKVSEAVITETLRSLQMKDGFSLNSEQRDGVLMAFQHVFSVLRGAAGTGETAVLRRIIDVAVANSISVVQLAIPGRAAQRMSAATSHPAMTCAKFLSQANKSVEVPDGAIVIIDEASMLDVPTFFRILRALPDTVSILLVGDPAQPPPINFGLILHRIVDATVVPVTTLRHVHRQVETSGIPEAARSVLKHEVPALVPFQGRHPGVSFVHCCADEVIPQLRKISSQWSGEDYQFLSAVKAGRAGVNAINKAFHADRSGELFGRSHLVISEPVIFQVNDYKRGIMNGTLGRVVEKIDGVGVVVDFDGDEQEITNPELAQKLDLAYAITVHKAQGSQFSRVAVVVGESKMLDHSLIYTALTRGIEQLVFIGDFAAFSAAIRAAPLAQLRTVGIDFSGPERLLTS